MAQVCSSVYSSCRAGRICVSRDDIVSLGCLSTAGAQAYCFVLLVLQRLQTAKALVNEDQSGGCSFGVDLDEDDAIRAVVSGPAAAGNIAAESVAGVARLKAMIRALKEEVRTSRTINHELQGNVEHAMSLLSDSRYFDTPSPAEIEERAKSRTSPSVVLVEMLTSAVASWKAKVRDWLCSCCARGS